jgi:hypothetical protein
MPVLLCLGSLFAREVRGKSTVEQGLIGNSHSLLGEEAVLEKELADIKAPAVKLLEAYAEIAAGRPESGLSKLREATADLLVIERNMRDAIDLLKMRRRL